jgi:hypothetical protein
MPATVIEGHTESPPKILTDNRCKHFDMSASPSPLRFRSPLQRKCSEKALACSLGGQRVDAAAERLEVGSWPAWADMRAARTRPLRSANSKQRPQSSPIIGVSGWARHGSWAMRISARRYLADGQGRHDAPCAPL